MRFRTKILLLVTGSIFLAIIITSSLIYHDVTGALFSRFRKSAEEIAIRLSDDLSYPLYIGNFEGIRSVIEQYIKFTPITGVTVNSRDGKIMVKVGKKGELTIKKEIFFKEEKNPYFLGEDKGCYVKNIGEATIYFSEREISALHQKILKRLLYVTLLLILSLGLLSYMVTDLLLQPIQMLRKGMEESKRSKEPIKIKILKNQKDELGELLNLYNEMVETLRETREQLRKTYEELSRQEKLAYLGKISATIAHELKNPLGIIHSSAELLRSKIGKNELLDFIISETERLDNVIKEFMMLARTKEPELRKIKLSDIVERAVTLWESSHDAEVVRKCEDGEALIDVDLFTHVITNLLTNAYEAKSEERELKIEIECKKEEDHVKLIVRDNGKGIEEETIERIFEPFFTTKETGTGMGLAIVYDIVKKHRGNVFVRSEKNRGTEVTIILPGVTDEKSPGS